MCSRVRRFMRRLVKFEDVPVHGGDFVTVTAPMLFNTTSKFVAEDPMENEFVTQMVGFPRLWSRTNLVWSYANRFSTTMNYDGIDVIPDYLCPFEFSKILLREFYGRTKFINGYHRGVVHFVGSTFHADVGSVSFLKGKWRICLVIHGDMYKGIDLVLEYFPPNTEGAIMAAEMIKAEVERRIDISSWVV